MLNVSIAPDGKKYPLPTEQENEKEREILKQITAEQRKLGRKIVAVQGLGFVGCVMATVVADATDKDGNPLLLCAWPPARLQALVLESSGDQFRRSARGFIRS